MNRQVAGAGSTPTHPLFRTLPQNFLPTNLLPVMNLFSHRVRARGRGSWAVAILMALGGIASSAFAQVEYVRELVGTEGIAGGEPLAITQGPIYYSDTPSQTIITRYSPYSGVIFKVNSATGVVSDPKSLPDGVFIASYSQISIVGQGAAQPYYYIVGPQGEIFTMNPLKHTLVYLPLPYIQVFAIDFYSIAAPRPESAEISFIYSDANRGTAHAMINLETGVATTTSVMSNLGSEALYQSYGQDGLLYILDYGNDRMVSFDPANALAQIGEFTLQTGITTANAQFAIGVNGNFYLGDGLGGGSTYAADGTYLNSFVLPEGVVGDPYTGASYLSTDSAGRVYVYDSATGFHQYQDMSVVPEPSTCALAVGALLGALIFSRRRRQQV